MHCKILLIGGTGIISSEIMLLALQKGHEVHLLNRSRSARNLPQGVFLHKADIRNKNSVKNAIGNRTFDVVVDFISYTVEHLENSFALFSNKCRQFIFISSACVYNREGQNEVITENSKLLNHNWDYGVNKVKCEEYLQKCAEEKGLKYTIVRPYITYGDTRIPFGIMPAYGYHWTFVSRILAGKPVFVWGDGKIKVAITHASDFAVGFVGLLMNEKAFNQIFHITTDETITWEEMIGLIARKAGIEARIIKIPTADIIRYYPSVKPMLLGDRSLNAVFDNSKIKNTVHDFHCSTSIKQGVENTVDAIKEQKYQKGIDYSWDAICDKLISKYAGSDKINNKKLMFIDYIGNASISDKYAYFLYRNFSEKYVTLYYKLIAKLKFFI